MNTTIDETSLALNELKSKFNIQSEQLNSQIQVDGLDEMTQKLIQYKIRVHELEETNDSLYQQILVKDNEIEKLIISTPISPPPADEDDTLVEIPAASNDVYGKDKILALIFVYIDQ
jgi:hypothetical protein